MADLASMGIITGSGLIMPELAAEVAGDLVRIEGDTFDMGTDDISRLSNCLRVLG